MQEEDRASRGAKPSLETAGPLAFEALRESLAAVVASVPGTAGRPVDLARAFGLDRKLAWKLSNLITGDGPDGAARYVPGEQGLRLFMDAARRRGAASALLRKCEQASATYRNLIRAHAGDRDSLDVLVNGLRGQPDDATEPAIIDLATRRSAYRAGAAIWGVRARAQYRAEFLKVSDKAVHLLDAMTVRGMVNVQRMRPGARWTLFRGGWVTDTSAQSSTVPLRRPIDPGSMSSSGVPLLGKYCSPAEPGVVRKAAPGSLGAAFADDVLEPGPVGPAGEVTVVTADRVERAVPRWASQSGQLGQVATRVRTPVEWLVMDIYCQRDVIDLRRASAEVLNDIDGTDVAPETMARLPCEVETEWFPRQCSSWELKEASHYGPMVRDVLTKVGWDPEAFELLRVRVQYPVIPSAVIVKFNLPSI